MFSHIVLGSDNINTSKAFYDATMQALGYSAGKLDEKGRCNYFGSFGILCITRPIDGNSASHGNGVTIGFKAQNQSMVDLWFNSGLANGGVECEAPPGIRTSPAGNLYQAFLRDPYGNKLCATYFIS
ncbi:TPA: VOC family protein [Vibrio parahaemolyticus]